MSCASCGADNPASNRFCGACGAPQERRCRACGQQNPPDHRFCGGCGAELVRVADEAPATARDPAPGSPATKSLGGDNPRPTSALEGERKVVTVVFADLAGSTALQERLDAESVRAFMQRYYEAMRGAVEAHGGMVAKLLGDGVLAVFGTPRVAEDDAPRAVHAAFEMRRAFRELSEQHTALVGAIGLRIAVNTGEVVASDDAEIIGDPVNVAARLQERCSDGEVVVGEATHRLVSQLVTLSPLGSFALKGRADAVTAFRVDSLERPSSAVAAAFVGRDEEMARISSVYAGAIEKPATALTVLIGSPGLGKSRLIEEFTQRLGDKATVVAAQCNEASLATFAPLADALRAHLGIDVGADAKAVRAAIEFVVPGDNAERARIVDGVAGLLAGSATSPEETFFVVRRFFAALASVRPVVLVIDDLQWAEPLLLDLVEHLVEWGSGIPLLVLVGARPELRDKRSSLAIPGALVTDVLTLGGLDAGAAMRLAANVIGAPDLPAVVAAKVLATSEGNPLFVGELVRMLVHEGALKREGERWTTGTALAALEMPPTIQALLAARIERLHPEERIVLERAAVVGRQFSRNAVEELLPRDVTELDSRFESLGRSELIERDTGWFLGEPMMRFHHVLIRDAAYRQLLKGTRAKLHSRFADWVLARAGDSVEHDETIGWHLEQAHQNLRELGPIDAQGRAIGERASKHLGVAGRRALAGDDVSLAASLLGRAIERLDPDDPARAELALDWCEALLAAGDVGPAAGAIDELGRFANAAETADCERLRAWHTCFAGQHTVLTAPEGLQETADSVAAAAESLAAQDDVGGEAKAHFVYALALARLGKVGACEAALDRALAAARRVAGDRRHANTVLAIAPLAALWGPSPVTRASGRCLDVVRVLRITQGAPAVEAVALSCQGVLEALRGRTDPARRMLASSRELIEELGITQRLLEVDVFSGLVDLFEGDVVAAEGNLRGAYEGMRELGLGIGAAQAAALLARALLAQDRVAEAEMLSHESEALAGDDLKAAIAWRGARAEALARRGEHVAAVEFASAAVAIAAATDALLDHADARVALAAALRAAGRDREADAEERRANELWQAKGATLLADRAQSGTAPVELSADEHGGEPVDERNVGISEDRRAVGPAEVTATAEQSRSWSHRISSNRATAFCERFSAATSARDAESIEADLAEAFDYEHHPTATSYGKRGFMKQWRSMLRAERMEYRSELLGALGESLALGREWVSLSGLKEKALESFGPLEIQDVFLIEDDGRGLCRRIEMFATEHLGDALVRVYERYAELLPEGQQRDRAQITAQAVAAMLGTPDPAASDLSWSSTIEFVDHRRLGFEPLRGVDAMREWGRAMFEVEDFAIGVDDVLRFQPNAGLLATTTSGTARTGGGAYDRSLLSLWVFASDGLFGHLELFDADDEAAALARFDELVGTGDTSAARQPFANAATLVNERITDAWIARDWDAIEALHVSTVEIEDRRPIVRLSSVAGTYLPNLRFLFDVPNSVMNITPIATRGERLALSRVLFEGSVRPEGGPLAIDHLCVDEVNAEGLSINVVLFDHDDLDAAYAELDRRYKAGEGAHSQGWATLLEFGRAVVSRNWDAVVALCADKFVEYDHRGLAVLGTTRGAEAFAQNFSVLAGLSADTIYRIDHFRGCAHGYYSHGGWYGSRDGGDYEIPLNAVIELDADGLFVRSDIYDDDGIEAALARYAEIKSLSDRSTASRFENAATRINDGYVRAWAARDFDAVVALYSPSTRYDDRRKLMQLKLSPEASVEGARFMFEAPGSRVTITPIATRGERLALSHSVYHANVAEDGGPLAIDYLSVDAVDADGLISFVTFFDPDDLDAAYVELDARYAAGEGAVQESGSVAFLDVIEAFNNRDWDTVIAFSRNSNFGPTDHRVLGWGSTLHDAAMWVRAQQALVELSPDARYRIDHIRAFGHIRLVHMTQSGTREGGRFETPLIGIFQGNATGGLMSDIYDPEQVEEAFARFEELSAGSASDSLEAQVITPIATIETIAKTNAAMAALDRWDAAFEAGRNSGDWASMREVCSPTMVFEDRQRHALVTGDRETVIASARERAAVGANPQRQLIGTAGDRIALAQNLWSGGPADGRFELENQALLEVDESGLIDTIILFDLDDALAAQHEMRARWVAIDPAVKQIVDAASRFNDAFNAGDLSAVGDLISEDIVAYDHRWTGFGGIEGRDAYLDAVAALWDLADNNRIEIGAHWLAYDRQAGVTSSRRSGTIADGGDYESVFLVVFAMTDGSLSNIEFFEVDALDAALSRFEELRSDPLCIPPNAATRACDRSSAAVRIGDWTAVAAQVSDDFVYEDRGKRALVSGDVETWISSMQFIATQPAIRMHNEFIATVGDRIALEHMSWSARGDRTGDADFDLDKIRLLEIDADGRIRASLLFDEEDRADAFEEASLRFAAGEAAAFGGHAELLAFIQAFRRREWSEARAQLADDFVLVDHRTLGLGTLTGDAWIESFQALTELAPDATPENFRDLVYDRNGRVWFLRTTGTVPDGGPFENVMVALAFIVNGRLQRWELFDIEDADCAVARFKELTAEADNTRSPTDRRPNT